MSRLMSLTLGVLTAIGGFLDIGELVTGSLTGARFGLSLAWVVAVGVVASILYAEMSARIAAVTGRAVFDIVRERLGPRAALVNLTASFFINLITLAAEIGGVALALELASDVSYLLWVPLVAVLAWVVIWRVPYGAMERFYGLLGLSLLVFIVALFKLHPDWTGLWHQAGHPSVPRGEGHPTWFYYAVAVFGATIMPYEVVFFSSGAVEEGWSESDLIDARMNVLIGFPLGGALTVALMAISTVVLKPLGIEVDHLGQAGLPVAVAVGKVGVAFMLVGFFAATFGAAMEVALSSGYTVAQYFGWSWGKLMRPSEAPRFYAVCILVLVAATGLVLTTIDPVKLTEYVVVLSAVAFPLTYFPILVVANDRSYLGDHVNARWVNAIATVMLVVIVVASAVAIPLLVATKAGM
jgi:Mn2+/Fe2+ NRAMP family transporter